MFVYCDYIYYQMNNLEYKRMYEETHQQLKKNKQRVTQLQQQIKERCLSYLSHKTTKTQPIETESLQVVRSNPQFQGYVDRHKSSNSLRKNSEKENLHLKMTPQAFSITYLPYEDNFQQTNERTNELSVDQYQTIVTSLKDRLRKLQLQKSINVKELLQNEEQLRTTKLKLNKSTQSTLQLERKYRKAVRNHDQCQIEIRQIIQRNREVSQRLKLIRKQLQTSIQDEKFREIMEKINGVIRLINNEQKIIETRNDLQSFDCTPCEKYCQSWHDKSESDSRSKGQAGFVTPKSKNNFNKEVTPIDMLNSSEDSLQANLQKLKCKNIKQISSSVKSKGTQLGALKTGESEEQKAGESLASSTYSQLDQSKTLTKINEMPYIIEEDMQCPPDNPYIKRVFIRKKVIRRNLSAMSVCSSNNNKSKSKSVKMGNSSNSSTKNHMAIPKQRTYSLSQGKPKLIPSVNIHKQLSCKRESLKQVTNEIQSNLQNVKNAVCKTIDQACVINSQQTEKHNNPRKQCEQINIHPRLLILKQKLQACQSKNLNDTIIEESQSLQSQSIPRRSQTIDDFSIKRVQNEGRISNSQPIISDRTSVFEVETLYPGFSCYTAKIFDTAKVCKKTENQLINSHFD